MRDGLNGCGYLYVLHKFFFVGLEREILRNPEVSRPSRGLIFRDRCAKVRSPVLKCEVRFNKG
jgi:hypothetical protein